MKVLTYAEILSGLRELGLSSGDRVMVHSSMTALGKVEGGADTVIDALLEAVGPKGLVVVPTFACKAPFDPKERNTPLGLIANTFWKRPNAVRSYHPTHSVAAIGEGAAELISEHEKAPTAYGEGTPYYDLAIEGGKILLMGVDQDRNTTLHTVEAMADAPYLKDIEATYVDSDGKHVTIPVAAMAGPHRDFIGVDKLYRDSGVTKMGRIGSAVCRLMDGKRMLEIGVEAAKKDPAVFLCDNPACADCVMQRGKIKAARLSEESFTLAAVASEISDKIEELLEVIQGEGISALEVTVDEHRRFGRNLEEAGVKIVAIREWVGNEDGIALASKLKVPLVVPVGHRDDFDEATKISLKSGADVLIENTGAQSSLLAELYSKAVYAPHIAFNPGRFAIAGEKPFLQIFYAGVLRKQMAHFYIDDATFDGMPALPGMGNGEVKEIISMLRCRSYSGVMTLRTHTKGPKAFRQTAKAFWTMLDTM
jgi:aminoglycoside 3-N-acetyltransferase